MVAKYEPRWCVEFMPSWLRLPRASASTIVRSFLPWHFWGAMHMSSRVRWLRLAAYILLLILMTVVPYVLTQTTRAIIVRSQISAMMGIYAMAGPTAADYEFAIAQVEQGRITEEMLGYPVEQYLDTLKAGLAAVKAQPTSQPSIDLTYLEAIYEAVFLPYAPFSSGTVTLGNGMVIPYPPPSDYDDVIFFTYTNGTMWQSMSMSGPPRLMRLVRHIGIGIALTLLLPASFILLPASRRRAKVQWRHIGRIAVYSLVFPVAVITLLAVCMGLSRFPQTMDWVPALAWELPMLLWVLLPVWWWMAIRRYLHMQHALAVAVIMTIMIALMCAPIWLKHLPYWLGRYLL